MTPKVPISEIGTTTPGITVARTLRRKRKTTRMTSEIEMSSVISTSWTDARMVVVRSRTTDILIAGEIEACNCGSAASTRSTVSMILAPGWRKMMIRTDGVPSTIPALRTSSTESSTSATSERRTAAPLL